MSAVRSVRPVLLGLVAFAAALALAAPATARADDTYAAIAYSEKTGKYGYGYNFDSRDAAEDRAVSECKADDAKVVVWARNGWCALALSDNSYYGWGYGSSEDIAKDIAKDKCREVGGKNVRIAVSTYSSK